jgi:hypothetical protein
MQTWAMRILGALNILFAATGVWFSAVMIRMHWNRWPGSPSRLDWAKFAGLHAITILMIAYLAFLGIRLIMRDAKALWPLSLLFVAEIAYFLVFVSVTWVIMPMSMSKIAVGFLGKTLDPIAPQLVTGYPFVGLIIALVILMVRRRSERARL